MLDIFDIVDGFDNAVLVKCFARIVTLDRVVLDHEQDVCRYLVHALSVANIGIELAESEEDIG